jgi:hypothetical protein
MERLKQGLRRPRAGRRVEDQAALAEYPLQFQIRFDAIGCFLGKVQLIRRAASGI